MAAELDFNRAAPESLASPASLCLRLAIANDAPLLARLNRELIEDEGHRNPMTLPELEARMRGWLEGEYSAALFEREGRVVAYALYRSRGAEVHVRHLYVARDLRRQGIATAALRLLARQVWPSASRITLDVLVGNEGALAFYRALGFQPYALTLEIGGQALREPGEAAADQDEG